MIFFCSGSGCCFEWPYKVVPWYKQRPTMTLYVMVDSGVRAEPPAVAELLKVQMESADIGVCPDVLDDPTKTVERTEEWLRAMPKTGVRFERVLCTQGTVEDRIEQIRQFAKYIEWCGAGLANKRPNEPFTDDEREEIIGSTIEIAHAHGLRYHVFGVGCSPRMMRFLRRHKVDSFDSSAPLMAAIAGQVYTDELRRVRVGGDGSSADMKRRLISISLHNIHWAMNNGPRTFDAAGARAEIEGQGFLFGGADGA